MWGTIPSFVRLLTLPLLLWEWLPKMILSWQPFHFCEVSSHKFEPQINEVCCLVIGHKSSKRVSTTRKTDTILPLGYVFPISLRKFVRCVIKGEDGEIYKITSHQFRHNGVTDRLRAGFTLPQIAEMTAHHGTAMIYGSYEESWTWILSLKQDFWKTCVRIEY